MKESMKKKLRRLHLVGCAECGQPLTLEEMAFNETLCNDCQREVNAKAFVAIIMALRQNEIKLRKHKQ